MSYEWESMRYLLPEEGKGVIVCVLTSKIEYSGISHEKIVFQNVDDSEDIDAVMHEVADRYGLTQDQTTQEFGYIEIDRIIR